MQQVVDGRYQLDERLGIGGQGQVFRGRDLVTGATVAVKLMEHDSPESVARFRLEGRLAARIRDPHLVAALHYGTSNGQNFIVFDYIPGVAPVTKLLVRRVEPARVCELALQVLDALASLHEAGVVHQDVSPGNCLWRERDAGRLEVFLVDLGSAASRSPVTGGPAPSREPVGTANYMAPEMMAGDLWDHRVDLWSVGALMYRLLTGDEVDIDPDEPLEIPSPARLVPSIPRAVSDVVMGALTEAEGRFPSATVMADAIRRALPSCQPRAGIPKRTALGAMALVAVFAVLGTVAAQRVSVAAAAPEPATPEPASSASAPAPEPASPPEPGAVTPEPGAVTSEPAAVPPPPGPIAVVKRTKPMSWATVQHAVKKKAHELGRCSEDEFISLGLRISKGRVVLETVDGAVVSPMSHPCVRDVVARLTFPYGAEQAGVVGVPLTD